MKIIIREKKKGVGGKKKLLNLNKRLKISLSFNPEYLAALR